MSLPEKQYFSFQEIAKRWKMELQDLCDYALEEVFEVHAWVGKVYVEFGFYEETTEGEPFWVPTKQRSWHNGYAIVQPLDLRAVFRQGGCPVQLFKVSSDKESYLTLEDDQKDYIIELRDLVISRAERDRIEVEYDPCACGCDAVVTAKTGDIKVSSFPGRPSVMHVIIQHMKQRALTHALCTGLRQEAQYLYGWAAQHITDAQVPKPRSIENAIRSQFNALSDSAPFKVKKTGTH